MTVWYVRPLGDGDGKSFRDATNDFDYVKKVMKPGDDVKIFNMEIDAQVIDKDRVDFYFSNAGIDATGSTKAQALLVLSDYNGFYGARVHGSQGSGVVWAGGTHHGTFDGGEVYDNDGHGISSRADSMRITNNYVHDNYARKAEGYAHISGISYFAPELAGPQDTAYGAVISGNVVKRTGNDVKTDASGILVDTTLKHGYDRAILVKGGEVSENGGAGVLIYKSANVTVAGVYAHDNSTDPLKGRPPEIGVQYSHDVVIRNVRAEVNDDFDFAYKQGGDSYNVDLINNVMHGRIKIQEPPSAASFALNDDFVLDTTPNDGHVVVTAYDLHWM